MRAVYDELKALDPNGFHYATFKLDDGVSFMHLSFSEGERPPLPDLQAFRRFQEDIAERCDEPPVVTQLGEVGSFPSEGHTKASTRVTRTVLFAGWL